jgi:hypothetical protein
VARVDAGVEKGEIKNWVNIGKLRFPITEVKIGYF